jgi:prepilin-type N-terminal cleavage/methylation domain-containing protein
LNKETGYIERMLKGLIKSLENKHLNPRILESLDPIKGITLVELLIALTIFSVVMAGVYSLYINQVKHSTKEYKLAEHEMEFGIAKNIFERDIMMAGYGIADNYGSLPHDPIPIAASDAPSQATFDSIRLRGTAVGIFSRTSQGWSYITDNGPPVTFQTWSDSRENIVAGDRVIYMHPATREILTEGLTAIFTFPASPSGPDKGTLVYGIHSDSAALPYIVAEYVVGGTPPLFCASGAKNLLRAESRNSDPPLPGNREPVLNCVLDFQVAFGLDSGFEEDGLIDLWDNGGTQAAAYDRRTLKKRLKQVRIYVLVQAGNRDPGYTYSNPDNLANPNTVRVGDSALGTGRDVVLTPEQRKYPWKVIAVNVTPRNLR